MHHSTDTSGAADRAPFAIGSRLAIGESLAMLSEECAELFAQACSHFPAAGKKTGTAAQGRSARYGLTLVERLGRLQRWIDVHQRALDGHLDHRAFQFERSVLAIEEPDALAGHTAPVSPFDEVETSLRRLEARIYRLDELLSRGPAN
jgi:hypothetical protein